MHEGAETGRGGSRALLTNVGPVGKGVCQELLNQ